MVASGTCGKVLIICYFEEIRVNFEEIIVMNKKEKKEKEFKPWRM